MFNVSLIVYLQKFIYIEILFSYKYLYLQTKDIVEDKKGNVIPEPNHGPQQNINMRKEKMTQRLKPNTT